MRAYYLSHELAKQHQVHILSTDNAHRLEQEALPISSDISVQYLPTLDYRTIASSRTKKAHYSEESKSGLLGKTAVKALNSFPISSYIGEGGYRYRKAAFKAACQLIDEGKITHLWSSFRPYADHEIAAQLKAKYPQLLWIADYRDIHVDTLKDNVFWRSYQERKAKALMADADVVTTISKGCLDHLSHLGKKRMILYNGLPAVSTIDSSQLSTDKLQFTFTGSLYGENRDPSPLFEALRKLLDTGEVDPSKININYAGKDSHKWKSYIDRFQLEQISTIHGMLPYAEALELQQRSHINLLLTFSHPEVLGALTGKLFEYIASRKLILCLIKGVKDPEVETFVEQYSHGSTYYQRAADQPHILSFVQTAYHHFSAGDSSYFLHTKSIDDLRWPQLAARLTAAI